MYSWIQKSRVTICRNRICQDNHHIKKLHYIYMLNNLCNPKKGLQTCASTYFISSHHIFPLPLHYWVSLTQSPPQHRGPSLSTRRSHLTSWRHPPCEGQPNSSLKTTTVWLLNGRHWKKKQKWKKKHNQTWQKRKNERNKQRKQWKQQKPEKNISMQFGYFLSQKHLDSSPEKKKKTSEKVPSCRRSKYFPPWKPTNLEFWKKPTNLEWHIPFLFIVFWKTQTMNVSHAWNRKITIFSKRWKSSPLKSPNLELSYFPCVPCEVFFEVLRSFTLWMNDFYHQKFWWWTTHIKPVDTPPKIKMEPEKQPFEKENNLPNLHFGVPC